MFEIPYEYLFCLVLCDTFESVAPSLSLILQNYFFKYAFALFSLSSPLGLQLYICNYLKISLTIYWLFCSFFTLLLLFVSAHLTSTTCLHAHWFFLWLCWLYLWACWKLCIYCCLFVSYSICVFLIRVSYLCPINLIWHAVLHWKVDNLIIIILKSLSDNFNICVKCRLLWWCLCIFSLCMFVVEIFGFSHDIIFLLKARHIV